MGSLFILYMTTRRDPRLFLLLMAGVICILKTPSLWFQHQGGDELVYMSLAERWLETGRYSLQGSELLSVLPAEMYDRPLFHHPPLYAGLLAAFVSSGMASGAVLISWAGHLLALTGLGMEWQRWRRRAPEADPWPWLVAVAGLAFDPLMIFVGRKLWMDSLMAGFLTMAAAMFQRFAEEPRGSRRWLLGCGLFVGLGALLKLHAGAALLFFGVQLLFGQGSARSKWGALIWMCVPTTLLVAPWLFWFHHTYGVFLPHWTLPQSAGGAVNGFMAAATGAPWYSYVTRLLAMSPVLVLSGGMLALGSGGVTWEVRRMALWPLFWILLMTVLGLCGTSYELRYVAPAVPMLYAVVAMNLGTALGQRAWFRGAVLSSILFAGMQGGIYLLSGLHDEFAGFWELARAATGR